MKKLFLAFFLIGGTLAFQSCKDDEKPSNQISYDGEKVKITSVVYDSDVDSEGEGLYSHTVLALSGLEFTEGSIKGSGDALELYLVNKSEDGITAGTYTIGDNLEDGSLGAALYVDVVITDETQSFGDTIEAESGTVSIEKNGDTYTIVFDLTVDGKKLTGKYKGKITSITFPS